MYAEGAIFSLMLAYLRLEMQEGGAAMVRHE